MGCDWDGHVPDWLSRVMKMWRRSVPVGSLLAGDTSLPDRNACNLQCNYGRNYFNLAKKDEMLENLESSRTLTIGSRTTVNKI